MATGTQRRAWLRGFARNSASSRNWQNIRDRGVGAGIATQAFYSNDPLDESRPSGAHAAYRAIWDELNFDTAAGGGPVTYYQTCQAFATGTALTVKGVRKTLAHSGVGTASVLKRMTLGAKAVTGTGSVSLSKGLLYTVLVQVVATGTSTVVARTVLGRLAQVVGTGTVTLTKRIGKTLAATGTGAATVSKRVAKTLTVAATGTPSLTDKYSGFKLLQVNAVGAITTFLASFIPGGISVVAKVYRRTLLTYIRRR